MKTIFLLAIMLTFKLDAQIFSTMTVEQVPDPLPFDSTPVDPASLTGEYAIVNAYNGRALVVKEGDGLWTFVAVPGGVAIKGQRGTLEESGRELSAGLSESGSAWLVYSVDGADTVIIRSAKSGDVLGAGWHYASSSWAGTDRADGSSHQEWHLQRSEPSVVLKPKRRMYVRAGSRVQEFATKELKTEPTVTWRRVGSNYVYRFSISDPSVRNIFINRGGGDAGDMKISAKGISAPAGWEFILGGWFARKGVVSGVDGVFEMTSEYAPGPVLLEMMDTLEPEAISLDASRHTHRAVTGASHYRGSQTWVIGPAVPPTKENIQ